MKSRPTAIEALYGFNLPVHERYLGWMRGIVVDFHSGWSFQWARPVNDLLAERLPLTLLISLLSMVVSWLIAIPVGVVLRHPPVFDSRLCLYLLRLLGPRHPRIPPSPGHGTGYCSGSSVFPPAVLYDHLLRGRADAVAQVREHTAAPDPAAADHRPGRHRRHHPDHARQPARRGAGVSTWCRPAPGAWPNSGCCSSSRCGSR